MCGQGINDFNLATFSEGGVNITGLRLVDILNKTVRDFILERQSRQRTTNDGDSNGRRISVCFSRRLNFAGGYTFYRRFFFRFTDRSSFFSQTVQRVTRPPIADG